jgi:hypothetical protein
MQSDSRNFSNDPPENDRVQAANRLKGLVSEAFCRAHFMACGRLVDAVGIEHIAPHYLSLLGSGRTAVRGNYARAITATVQKMPDLIISYAYPGPAGSTQVDAVLVDVKYRSAFDPELIARVEQHYALVMGSAMGALLLYVLSPYGVNPFAPTQRVPKASGTEPHADPAFDLHLAYFSHGRDGSVKHHLCRYDALDQHHLLTDRSPYGQQFAEKFEQLSQAFATLVQQ